MMLVKSGQGTKMMKSKKLSFLELIGKVSITFTKNLDARYEKQNY